MWYGESLFQIYNDVVRAFYESITLKFYDLSFRNFARIGEKNTPIKIPIIAKETNIFNHRLVYTINELNQTMGNSPMRTTFRNI